MSPKASSLAIDEVKQKDALEESYAPKLSVLVKSRNGLIECPVSTDEEIIRIGGRITISF